MKSIKINYVYYLLFIALSLIFLGAESNNTVTKSQSGDWEAPAEADKLKNPLKDLTKASELGEELFNVQCAICHGESGTGDGIAGVGLTPRPADLTSEKVQKQSDGAIFWKITTGRPPMASYEAIYSDEQRWQLVAYIRTLPKK